MSMNVIDYQTLYRDLVHDGQRIVDALPHSDQNRFVLDSSDDYCEVGWGSPFDCTLEQQFQEVQSHSDFQRILQHFGLHLPHSQVDSATIAHVVPLYMQVRNKLEVWKSIGCAQFVLEWIEQGVWFQPTEKIQPFFQKQIVHSQQQLKYWRDHLRDHYINSGAIVEIYPPPWQHQYISRSFFVDKSSGGYRLVLDLKFLNNYFQFPKVTFENLAVLRYAPQQITHCFSIDVSDAYHHLALHQDLQQFFQFKLDGHFYQCIGLPFGWNIAPGVFTKFMKQLINAIRDPSIISMDTLLIKQYNQYLMSKFVTAFLDDTLAGAQGLSVTTLFSICILDLMFQLSVFFQLSKSVVIPTTTITHLGFQLDVTRKLFLLTPKQEQKIATKVNNLLKMVKGSKRLVRKKLLARVVGYLQSTSLAVKSTRLHLLSIYSDLHSVDGWRNNTNVRLSNKSIKELEFFWLNIPACDIGRSWYPPECSTIFTSTLITDASKYAWGSHYHIQRESQDLIGNSTVVAYQPDQLSSKQTQSDKVYSVQLGHGAFPLNSQQLGSTLREFDALLAALRAHSGSIRNQFIRYLTDNTGVLGAVRNQFSKVLPVRERVYQLQQILTENNANLVAQHIKGEQNVVSDTISRIDIGDSFQFNQYIFDDICTQVGRPTIDRFATSANTLLQYYNTYFFEENTSGIDAFAQQNWLTEFNFCNPPFSVLGRFVNFLVQKIPLASCLIIVPFWTGTPWFDQLFQFVDKVYLLPVNPDLFVRILPQHLDISYIQNPAWRFLVMTVNVPYNITNLPVLK